MKTNPTVPTVHHPLRPEDGAATAAMRGAIGPTRPTFGIEMRGPFDETMERTPDAPGVAYAEATVGGVPGWWCRPEGATEGAAILYLHGGAYVVGSARADRHLAGQVAARAGVAAFVPEYRLAPEHPFPAAMEDAAAAYRGLTAGGFSDLALVGDSAGGGLALVILSLMVAGGQRPVGAAAMSPWTDLALEGESMDSRAEADPLLTRDSLAGAARLYLGAHDPRDPLASPLYGDLTGLPPVRLHVGEDEVLLDDARRYAERFVRAGMAHVFPSGVGALAAAGAALDDLGAFLRAAFRGGRTA